jgi:nucleotide-binding universal stress UspA family protein
MFKMILVPIDGSELTEKALAGALDYAQAVHSRLVGVAVVEPYPYYFATEVAASAVTETMKWAEEYARTNLEKFGTRAKEAGVEYETAMLYNSSPADEIVHVAGARRCDAIFMASHGRRGLDALLLGSQTHKVLIRANIPVVVFR